MDFDNLIDRWLCFNENKYAYAFLDEEFNKDEFTQLIKETLFAIRDYRSQLFDLNNSGGTIKIFDFSQLLVEMAKYSVDVSNDESEDYIFSASQAIVRLLLDYANFPCKVIPTDETGVLYGSNEDCEVYCPNVEDMNNDFWTQNFKYDPNTGDMSMFIELVKKSHDLPF